MAMRLLPGIQPGRIRERHSQDLLSEPAPILEPPGRDFWRSGRRPIFRRDETTSLLPMRLMEFDAE
jgi:hypothetical protein